MPSSWVFLRQNVDVVPWSRWICFILRSCFFFRQCCTLKSTAMRISSVYVCVCYDLIFTGILFIYHLWHLSFHLLFLFSFSLHICHPKDTFWVVAIRRFSSVFLRQHNTFVVEDLKKRVSSLPSSPHPLCFYIGLHGDHQDTSALFVSLFWSGNPKASIRLNLTMTLCVF